MSRISDIYDFFRTELATLFSSKRELDVGESGELEENAIQLLDNGWGVEVAEGINTFRMVGCKQALRRNFIISLTRRVSGLRRDNTKTAKYEKLMLEDHFTLMNFINDTTQINNESVKINYEADTGIIPIVTDRNNYIAMQLTISVEYFETIT